MHENQTALTELNPFQEKGKELKEVSASLEVTNYDEAEKANKHLEACQSNLKDIEGTRKDLVKPHNDVVKQINKLAKEVKEPAEEAKAIIKGKIVHFNAEQERIKKAEGKRTEDICGKIRQITTLEELSEFEIDDKDVENPTIILAIQNKKAEIERKIEEAEEERRRAEEQARLDKLNAEERGKEAERMKEENEKREAEAEEKRKEQEAEKKALEKEAKQKEEAEKVKGIRKVTKFEVVDENKVPRPFLSVDEKKLREAIKNGMTVIEGVKIWQEEEVR